MHAHKPLLAFTAFVLLLTACRKADTDVRPATEAASSIEHLAKKQGTARPFKGSMVLTPAAANQQLTCSAPANAPNAQNLGTFAGSGNLTHLGNTSLRICSWADANFTNVVGVCAEMIAANGNEIHTFTHPYAITGSTANITIDIIGGTGNFASASGSFTGTMTVTNMGTPSAVATFSNINGTISY